MSYRREVALRSLVDSLKGLALHQAGDDLEKAFAILRNYVKAHVYPEDHRHVDKAHDDQILHVAALMAVEDTEVEMHFDLFTTNPRVGRKAFASYIPTI